MRRFLIVFFASGGFSLLVTPGQSTTVGYKDAPSILSLNPNVNKKTRDTRGKRLLTLLKANRISCESLDNKGHEVGETPDAELPEVREFCLVDALKTKRETCENLITNRNWEYKLPEVNKYCSARLHWEQQDKSGHQWDKRNWKRTFSDEPVKSGPTPHSVETLPAAQLPIASGESHSPITLAVPVDDNRGLESDASRTHVTRTVTRRVPRDIPSLDGPEARGGTQHPELAQQKLNNAYNNVFAHLKQLHTAWETLEREQKTSNPEKLRPFEERFIRQVGQSQSYIGTLDRQNSFLGEELGRLFNTPSPKADRVALQKFHSMLNVVGRQNGDLHAKIKKMHQTYAALTGALKGKITQEVAEEIYQETIHPKPNGNDGNDLRELEIQIALTEKKGHDIGTQFEQIIGHTCPGDVCPAPQHILHQAKELEQKIQGLRAELATLENRDTRGNIPRVQALEAKIATLDTGLTKTIEGLRAELGTAQQASATADKVANNLLGEQEALRARVAQLATTEAAAKARVAEVERQEQTHQLTARQAEQAKAAVEKTLQEQRAEAAKLLAQNTALEEKIKRQAGRRILSVFQANRARRENAEIADNLRGLNRANEATVAALKQQLQTSELEKTEALSQVRKSLLSSGEAERGRVEAERKATELEKQQQRLNATLAVLQQRERDLGTEIVRVQATADTKTQLAEKTERQRKDLQENLQRTQNQIQALSSKNDQLGIEMKRSVAAHRIVGALLQSVATKKIKEAQEENQRVQAELAILRAESERSQAALKTDLDASKASLVQAQKEREDHQRQLSFTRNSTQETEQQTARERLRLDAQINGLAIDQKQAEARAAAAEARAAAAEARAAAAPAHSAEKAALEASAAAALAKKDQEILELKGRKSQLLWQKFISAVMEKNRLEKIGSAAGTVSLGNDFGFSQSLADQTKAILQAIADQKAAFETQAAQLGELQEALTEQDSTIEKLSAEQERLRALAKRAETLQREITPQQTPTLTDTRSIEERVRELQKTLKEITREKDNALKTATQARGLIKSTGLRLTLQQTEMETMEANREKLEATLRDQERQLEIQSTELRELGEAARSDWDADEAIQALRDKTNRILTQSKAEGKTIGEQRKQLAKLLRENEQQKQMIAEALLANQQFSTENEDLKRKI